MFIGVCSLFRGDPLSADMKIICHKAIVRSVMTSVRCHLSEIVALAKQDLRAISHISRCRPVLELLSCTWLSEYRSTDWSLSCTWLSEYLSTD
jgi:hypothetical protein